MEEQLSALSAQLVRAGVILLLAIAARILVRIAIRHTERVLLARAPEPLRKLSNKAQSLVKPESEAVRTRRQQRVGTLASLLRNIADIVIVVVAGMTILAIFHVPMGPLLASAGIGGVAIGFGAQSLVKDYLSGIFMLAEDQFGVGDLITVDDVTGTVEEVTLRVTRVRDAAGTTWYLRNGEILKVGNVSKASTFVIVDVPVAPDEDPERAAEVIGTAVSGMHEEPAFRDLLTAEPTVLGVGAIDASAMTMQVLLTAAPNKQWGPMRAVRQRAQQALVEAGVRGALLPGHVAE
ncbi:mechanosensitive ion channel family protein [uncultured Tessaracoccus sp.]|uniref:mechanosensitive ion channel family protein n=1 Tax=uncultured Tessaracoccus sp. TaxID=905023 RepID=UPI0025DCB3FC|nr:mechanosensitive ion channel family protein [uncultured Tessaracoccus sp.]